MLRTATLTAALALGLVACRGPGAREKEGFTTASAEQGELVMTVTAVGSLQPLESVDIGSDLSGQVQEVLVEANDRVSAGQVLARLDAAPFEIAVTEARGAVASAMASIQQSQVNLEKAKTDLERTRLLVDKGVATQVELLNARTQVDLYTANLAAARAQLVSARGALERAQDNLASTEILSPIDGVVLQRQIEPGQTVVSSMSATTAFTVASDLSRMKAEVDIDEADVARIAPQQPATFTVSAWPDRSFEAQVAQVDLAPDPTSNVVVYVAELHLDNPDGALRPGMTATATIETGRLQQSVLVPASALRFAPAGERSQSGVVWTLSGEAPSPLQVTVLGTDGMMSAVEGIEAGTTVITGGR